MIFWNKINLFAHDFLKMKYTLFCAWFLKLKWTLLSILKKKKTEINLVLHIIFESNEYSSTHDFFKLKYTFFYTLFFWNWNEPCSAHDFWSLFCIWCFGTEINLFFTCFWNWNYRRSAHDFLKTDINLVLHMIFKTKMSLFLYVSLKLK